MRKTLCTICIQGIFQGINLFLLDSERAVLTADIFQQNFLYIAAYPSFTKKKAPTLHLPNIRGKYFDPVQCLGDTAARCQVDPTFISAAKRKAVR